MRSKQTPPGSGSPSASDTYELRNELCSVVIAVSEGARIASLRSMRSGLEFLTPAREPREPVTPAMTTPFQAGPCAGIEECLPSVGPCASETPGGAVPDHGDFWQLPWTVRAAESDRVVVEADGFSRPFRLRKEIWLDNAALRVLYTVENRAETALPFLYACHPLFAVERGDRIVLPPEVDKLELYYSRKGRKGQRKASVRWPTAEDGEALDRAGGPQDGVAEMYYTAALREGRCGIHREATGEALEIVFDVNVLPYLGLWLCYGGWPDGGGQPLQYAVALEPTTSPCNTLAEAVAANNAPWLASGGRMSWGISFKLLPPNGGDVEAT